jgi:hypothetical protein
MLGISLDKDLLTIEVRPGKRIGRKQAARARSSKNVAPEGARDQNL